MVAKKQLSVAAIILIMVAAFPFCVTSQTKHVSKWIVENYWFDFSTNPVSISQLEGVFYEKKSSSNIYIDADGAVRLVQVGFALYDGNGNEIKYEGAEPAVKFSYFIPMPNNDNIICCIGEGALYKIDIENNKIISVERDVVFPDIFLAVHNADCSGIWLLQLDGYSIKRQLLTSEGIKEAHSTPLSDVSRDALCNLSWDCKYYTWRDFVCDKICDRVVYFGVFDRRTGTFRQTSSHIFKWPIGVYTGVFAPDNSKVYYALNQDDKKKIVEIPIVGDSLEFNRMKTVCQFETSTRLSTIRMGLDGRLYVFENKNIHVVEFYDNGKSRFINNYLTLDTNTPSVSFYSYLPDWYSDDPCSGTPCPDMPAPVIIRE